MSYRTYDEIESSYLVPWSRGENSWQGQVVAVYVLWFMYLDESLVPAALSTADWWAGQGTTEQRRTAIWAFSGEFGVRFPTHAARRLWQLVLQSNDLSQTAAVAFGELFATLTANDAEAGHVVRRLRAELDGLKYTGRARLRYKLTLLGVLAVLEARNGRSGNLAVMEYLRGHPERLRAVAELWAAVLKHRPCRHRALLSLLNALNSLEQLGGESAEQEARALGDGLGAALPQHEHQPFKTDFSALAARSNKRPARSAVLTKVLLSALDRAAEAL
jgi:hypothetical protein